MKNTIVILKDEHLAIRHDAENKNIYVYDIDNISGEVDFSTEGILREINPTTAAKIVDNYDIELKDYGVEIIDKTIDTDIRIIYEL